MKKEKIGIIDVGGGLRGIYGSGVFDYLMEKDIYFPYCIGVSAGSGNIAFYLSKQKGVNKNYYTECSFDKDYMSISNIIRKGSYIDLDYIYGTLSNDGGKYPWDYDAAMNNPSEMVVVATNAKTGEPEYFTKKDFRKNNYGILKASSCIPVACKAYKWDGKYYYDGTISDPIPFQKAFEDGCTKVVVILTRPVLYRKKERYKRFFGFIKNSYPKTYDKLKTRCDLYNNSLDLIVENYSDSVFVIGPDDMCGVDTFKTKRNSLERLYKKGYNDGKKVEQFLIDNNLIGYVKKESIN